MSDRSLYFWMFAGFGLGLLMPPLAVGLWFAFGLSDWTPLTTLAAKVFAFGIPMLLIFAFTGLFIATVYRGKTSTGKLAKILCLCLAISAGVYISYLTGLTLFSSPHFV